MGQYATTTAIQHLLVNYLEGNSTGSDPFAASTASKHIERAEARIHSELAARYSLPISPTPPELRRLAEDISCYYLIRASNYQSGQRKSEYLEEFKSALDYLKLISDGEKNLTYTDGSVVQPLSSNHFVSDKTNYTPIFGLDDPDQWQRDEDEIADQEADRA